MASQAQDRIWYSWLPCTQCCDQARTSCAHLVIVMLLCSLKLILMDAGPGSGPHPGATAELPEHCQVPLRRLHADEPRCSAHSIAHRGVAAARLGAAAAHGSADLWASGGAVAAAGLWACVAQLLRHAASCLWAFAAQWLQQVYGHARRSCCVMLHHVYGHPEAQWLQQAYGDSWLSGRVMLMGIRSANGCATSLVGLI